MSNRTVSEADRTRNNRDEDRGKMRYFDEKNGDSAKFNERVVADRKARMSEKYRGLRVD